MAWTYQAGNDNNYGNASSASVTHGFSINAGDLIVAYVNRNSTSSVSADADGATWTEAVNETPSGETGIQALYWKIAGGSEPSSYGFTFGSSDHYQVLLKHFRGSADPEVDAAGVGDKYNANVDDIVVNAIAGEVISDDAVSIVAGGFDNRGGAGYNYGTVNNSFVSVIGDENNQASAMAHRIYTTGVTFSGNVTIDDAGSSLSDLPYGVHISFVEASGGGGDTLTTTSLASGTTIPTPTISSAASLAVTGVSTGATVPTPGLVGVYGVTATSISSSEVVPTPGLSSIEALVATSISSTLTIPTPVLDTGAEQLTVTSLAADSSIPTPGITSAETLVVTSITEDSGFETPVLDSGGSLVITSISSELSVPTPNFDSAEELVVTSISEVAQFGSTTYNFDVVLTADSISADEGFGLPEIADPASVVDLVVSNDLSISIGLQL